MRPALLLPSCFCIVVIAASAFAQAPTPSPCPDRPQQIFYSEVLDSFRPGKGTRPSNAEISERLINQIRSCGAYIVLNDRDRKELREAGASDELIRTIDTALTYAEKKKVTKALKNINKMNRLYQIVLNNYKSKDEKQLARAIKAAKEFIRRFGNEEIASRNTEWLKYSIPKWEQRLQKVSRVSTTNH